jgi:hypothetical protein
MLNVYLINYYFLIIVLAIFYIYITFLKYNKIQILLIIIFNNLLLMVYILYIIFSMVKIIN